ncbi:MAG: PAS domain-containing sensor histidine kinase [Rhodobacteraceae bacterium]|nr:PAS domain-containing sensor histidine kinase [Paracoccaceae bacterium]
MMTNAENTPENVLWNSLPMPAFITDGAGRISDANTSAEFFLNAPLRRLVGRKLKGVLCSDAALTHALLRAEKDHGAVFLNNVVLNAGLEQKDADIQISHLSGEESHLLVLVQLRRFGDNLGRGDTVKKAARSAIGMAEMLAHEIKNPLAGVIGAAQLLAMSASPEDRELTELIVGESHRIVTLLEQVEQFGNLRPPECNPVNIHDLLDRSHKLAKVGFASHMEFRQVYDPSLPPTFVDGDQMMQVFLNLMKNAAEAAGKDGQAGGVITLKTSYDHGLSMRGPDGQDTRLPLQVEIIDNGPGIAPDIMRQMFEPFVSGRENGTGLGLALVSKILSDHGAWISVDSKEGRTSFRLSLPVAPKGES